MANHTMRHNRYHPLRQHSVAALDRARALLGNLNRADFAAALSVSPHLVAMWYSTPTSKRYFPLSLDLALTIHDATQGAVTLSELLPGMAVLFNPATPVTE